MGYRLEKPRQEQYTFYIAALDSSGNYSEPNQFTINHPGIQKLDLQPQDVTNLLASIKIKLPKVYSETSQQVYNSEPTAEVKEILGYRLFIQELNYNTEEPIGGEEIIDYDAQEINEKGIIYYQSETGKKYQIKVGAYDSVYHPDYNPDLFELTVSDSVIGETFRVERPDISEALIKPNNLTSTLQGTGLTQDDFGAGGIEQEFTIQAGVWDDTTGEPIVGGIGLAYNEADNDIDVQVVADRFRLFDPDIEPNGKSLFATGTVDGTSQIYMNANNIAMIAENSNLSTDNFFELSGEGLSINTEDFKLNKDGTAIFSGEVSATQFSLNSGDLLINDNGITSTQFNLNASTGDAIFGGELQAAGGTFTGELQAAGGTFTGDLSAAGGTFTGDLSAAGGTFTGDLEAASGTFAGSLEAASGTFAGSLEAASGTFAGSLEAAGGTFSGNLDAVSGSFSDGNVNIDSSGININNGGLTVTNSSGTTIIDGTSNMFKIHQTGTVYCGSESSVNVNFPDLGYRPSFLVFALHNGEVVPTPLDVGQIFIRGIITSRTNLRLENDDPNTGVNFRYYILKEESI